MHRAELIARLAVKNGYVSAAQGQNLPQQYQKATKNSQQVAPPEWWAVQIGFLTADQAGMLGADVLTSHYHCAACKWRGVGNELRVEGAEFFCPRCANPQLAITHGTQRIGGAPAPQPAPQAAATPIREPDPVPAAVPFVPDFDADFLDGNDALDPLPGAMGGHTGIDMFAGIGAISGVHFAVTPDNMNVNDLQPGVMVADWQIEAKVGQGAMGLVYRAMDVHLDRPVAIKIINPDLLANRNQVERFLQEAKVLARLEHPNVLQIYRLGNINGRPYIVVQWLDGESLGTRMKAAPRVSLRDALELLLQAAKGLSAAHQKGIVHRDVKPDNLMLTADGTVKVADFGLAKHGESDRNLAQVGSFMGTPGYVAPEQIEGGHHADARADIYSLAITGFHLLTGQLPFTAKTLPEMLMHHQRTPMPSARALNPEIPPALDDLLRHMAAKQPAHRPASMGEVIEHLEEIRLELRAAIRTTAAIPVTDADSLADPDTPASAAGTQFRGRAASGTGTVPARRSTSTIANPQPSPAPAASASGTRAVSRAPMTANAPSTPSAGGTGAMAWVWVAVAVGLIAAGALRAMGIF